MCGIAGALDLTGTREFPVAAAPGDDRRDRPSRARRRADPHRAGRRAGGAPALDRRPGRGPAADRQRGRRRSGSPSTASCSSTPSCAQELLARGHRLATRCDTEAWVHLYEDHGEGMFEKARGQFAVSLWDRNNRTLILGRDRVGICPLYYAERDGWLLWGSEVKALLASGLVAGAARPEGDRPLLLLLLRGDDRGRSSRGSSRSRPGHYLQGQGRPGRAASSTGTSTSPTPARSGGWTTPTPLVDELEDLLRQAVERRLRGDVPVVSYISGGLDSTVVLGLSSPAAGPGGAVVHDRPRPARARTSGRRRPSRPRCSARR